MRFNGRSAAVTPMANSAHGAAASDSVSSSLSAAAAGGLEHRPRRRPAIVAMMNGWVKMRLTTWSASVELRARSWP